MTSARRPAAGVALLTVLLAGCSAAPPRAPLAPSDSLVAFESRRLEKALPELPPPSTGWDFHQWFTAALRLNPQLAEQRAEVAAAAASKRTAAEYPNPAMQLFGEYLAGAARSGAWLYGLSLDFLLRRPGERARAREQAALQTALAESGLAESIWEVRAAVRQALLDAVAAQDESALAESLIGARQALLESDRARLRLGDIARPQLLPDELELSRARARAGEVRAHRADATARLAAAVGVPVTALDGVPLRWPDWAAIDTLSISTPQRWRAEALIGRPQIVRALRQYDLAETDLESEVSRRWPQLHVTPAYAWGGDGTRSDTLYEIASESGAALSFELPILNQHQGPIGEAIARRAAAGEHLKAVQAEVFGQIDRAELAWPLARQAWLDASALAELADRQYAAEQRALAAGAAERSGLLSAHIAALEARSAMLQAAYAAEVSFGELEDAYHRPLAGQEAEWPPEPVSP